MTLEANYRARFSTVLQPLAKALEEHLRELLSGQERVDRVQARAKSIDRFLAKALKEDEGIAKYSDPINQIQDQVGARIICFYLSDVERISEVIDRYFRPIEVRRIVPDGEAEFGYFGKHYVMLFPTDVIESAWDRRNIPDFFELQIKTLFQHAWSEADHDLGYKPGSTDLTKDQKRRVAFTAAQAWGADMLFDNLFKERTPN